MPNKNEHITPSSIVNQFVSNVNNIILANAVTQSNVPRFSGTVYYNYDITVTTTSVAFSNPQAIPPNDLDFSTNAGISNVQIGTKGNHILGSTMYNVLKEIVKRLTRVRNFSSSWYHRTQTSYTLVNSVSGKAMFKETLPSITGTSGIRDNSATSGWNRSINGSAIQNIEFTNNPGISKNGLITANVINQFFTNLNNYWAAAAGNRITYTLYSCHNNCHNNCHDSCHSSGRSRR